ncbi:two-component system, chemotaxis family, chemotaxis protein CheV [Gammaproteobacteria bacterium]
MAGVLDGVDQRTQLVGYNRLELLLFRLGGKQRFGINVFKVREVIQCPTLTRLPGANSVVRGIANIRGRTIPVMDLGVAVGKPPLENLNTCYVIITEYNRVTQGFLVSGVDRIVNMNWEEIHPPPRGSGRISYLTAVTQVDKELVEIIDVEKVLAEVTRPNEELSKSLSAECAATPKSEEHGNEVLVVDDSSVARKQIQRTLEQVGISPLMANNGREALNLLHDMATGPRGAKERLAMIISDIEMPEMDGYTLTTEIRRDPALKDIYVLLHTSLSGVFNQSMVKKVGADQFIAKFSPDDLARAVLDRVKG